MKIVLKHLPDYISLIAVLLVGVIIFIIFSYNRYLQAACTISMAISYLVWGLVHHYLHKDLDLSVFVEYTAVATLGLVIIFSLLFRA